MAPVSLICEVSISLSRLHRHVLFSLHRKDNTKVVTRIKNISGDIDIFLRELRIVLSLPEPANQLQSYDDIRLRAGNMIEIQDHRAKEIRLWLGGLGF